MAIRISEVKSSRLSDDKKEVIVGSSGKYIGEVELKIARECLDDFIDALVSARGRGEDKREDPGQYIGAAEMTHKSPLSKLYCAIDF